MASRKTKFEISDADFDKLSRIKGGVNFNTMGQKEWMKKTRNVVYNFLDETTSKINDIKRDQEERAKKIIEDLLDRQPKVIYSFDRKKTSVKRRKIKKKKSIKVGTVILMDGHGRMVWQLLNYWYNVKGKTDILKIIVIEFNGKNHRFHKEMFPKDITSIRGNVFDKNLYKYKISEDEIIECDPVYMVVYFNFTSIGDQGPILYNRLASNAYEGISTHWSYMPQIMVKREKQDKTSTLLVTTHNFITDFGYFYGQIAGNKFISYPINRYTQRAQFFSFRLNFHAVKKCLEFSIKTLMNNCRQFERDLIRDEYENLEKILSLNKKAIRISQLKEVLAERNTSIVKGMRDLCSLNIYDLKCDGDTVMCGSTVWELGTIIQAKTFIFIMKWIFHGMYYRYKNNIIHDDDDDGTIKDLICAQLLDVFQSISYRIINHILKGNDLRGIYSNLMGQRSWGDSPLGEDFSWIRDDEWDGPFVNGNETIENYTDWQTSGESKEEGGESKSNLQDTLINAFRNLRF